MTAPPAAGRGDTDRKRYCEDCTPGLSCQFCEVTAAPVTGPATDRGATDRGGEAVCKCPFGGCACDHAARPAGDRAQPTQEPSSNDVAVEDVRAIAVALGLGGHARPYSAHEVVRREILPALAALRRALDGTT